MNRKTVLGFVVALFPVLVACASQALEDDETEGSELAAQEENEDDFVVIDRMGRPEMTNVTLGMGVKELNADTRAPESQQLAKELTIENSLNAHVRAYNHQNTFHPKPGERGHAKRVLAAGIRASDVVGLLRNNPQDWSAEEIEIVTDILSEDALVVDISKRCNIDSQSFFDIERSEYLQRGGKANDTGAPLEHRTCGGRTLNDDVIDEMLTMWINKSFDLSLDNPNRISDHIDKPKLDDGEPSNTFPYLGEPHADYKE